MTDNLPVAPSNPMADFMERLKKSLRDDVARMIPDEALSQMIQQVIKDEFFTKRIIDDPTDRSSYTRRKIEKGTVFQDIVMAHAKPILEKLAAAWVKENEALLLEQWREVTNTGLMQYVEELQRDMATRALREQLNGWLQKLNDERIKQGLPVITNPMF